MNIHRTPNDSLLKKGLYKGRIAFVIFWNGWDNAIELTCQNCMFVIIENTTWFRKIKEYRFVISMIQFKEFPIFFFVSYLKNLRYLSVKHTVKYITY